MVDDEYCDTLKYVYI